MTRRAIERILLEVRFLGWGIEERYPDSRPLTPRQVRKVLLYLFTLSILTIVHLLGGTSA